MSISYTVRRLLPTAAMLLAFSMPAPAAGMPGMPGMPAMGNKPRVELGTSAAFAPDGRLFAVSRQGDHLALYRSDDEGKNWLSPVIVNAQPETISADGENRPKLAFAHDGGLLVSWTRPMSKPYSGEIRLARSGDGQHFSAPITVHRDRSEITHRFDSMVVAGDGRVMLAWIDKRDLEAAKGGKTAYRGAAIYAAISTDGGRSFQPEQKLADHSCECCRITSAVDADGAPLFMWRHVFAPNERDHALVRIKPDGTPEAVLRATFDHWRIDACPHHGPSLVVDSAGVRHAVWFNQKDGEGRVFYGRLEAGKDGISVTGQRAVGSPRAEHADLATSGSRVALVWKEFDGERTRIYSERSQDGGQTFSRAIEVADTVGPSDQPRVLQHGDVLYAFWRTEREGMRTVRLPY